MLRIFERVGGSFRRAAGLASGTLEENAAGATVAGGRPNAAGGEWGEASSRRRIRRLGRHLPTGWGGKFYERT